jgi:phasin family protein
MIEVFQKWTDESQRISKEGFDTAIRSYGELTKGSQAIATKVTDYLKKALEDATRAFEQLTGSKSVEQAIEIQSQYAKKAYDAWVAEASKFSETYVGIARDAYRPVEQAIAKRAPKAAAAVS